MPLPIYIQNEGEMMPAVKEDDNIPSPVDTPSMGSLSSSHVVDVGNRVLDLIKKHKREIRARMGDHEKSFREMLHQESENHWGRRDRARERSNGSDNSAETSSSSTTRGSNTLKETFVDAYLAAARHAQARKAPEPRRNVASIYSDEYLDIPQPDSDGVSQFVPNKIYIGNIKRRTESPNRAAHDMWSRKDQYEQSQKYGRSFSPRVSPKRKSSDNPEAESGLDPVVAEERLYVPDEHYENSKDGFNSSSSDDDDGDDGVPVNRANNNHVTFQSENQHEYSNASGNAVASASLRQRDDLNINHDDNDYDTSAYDADADSRRSSNPEAKPSQISLDTSIHTDRSEDSFDRTLDAGLGKPRSKNNVAPQTLLRQVPSSSSSSLDLNASIRSIEDGPTLWQLSYRDISEHWIEYSWQLGVALVILLMAIGIFIMSNDDLQNPVASEGAKRVKRKSLRNYGPLL